MWGVFGNPNFDLKPGMFVRVRMDVGQPRPALFVAEEALGSDQGRRYLYVVNDDNKTVYTQVDVGQAGRTARIAVKPRLRAIRLIREGRASRRQRASSAASIRTRKSSRSRWTCRGRWSHAMEPPIVSLRTKITE